MWAGAVPLSVRFGPDDPPKPGDRVLVRFSPQIGRVGIINQLVVENRVPCAIVYFAALAISGPFEGFGGADWTRGATEIMVLSSLRKVVDSPPRFASETEAQVWLDSAGDRDFYDGQQVQCRMTLSSPWLAGTVRSYSKGTVNDRPHYSILLNVLGEPEIRPFSEDRVRAIPPSIR